MKWNIHLIGLSRGHKYELDRFSWTQNENFNGKYIHNYSNMVSTGASEDLETPEWHDKTEKVVEEADTYGCKVTHQLSYPELCVLLDEVGININNKKDGDIRGERYLYE